MVRRALKDNEPLVRSSAAWALRTQQDLVDKSPRAAQQLLKEAEAGSPVQLDMGVGDSLSGEPRRSRT